MSKFDLNIGFDKSALDTIYEAGQKVTIVKLTDDSSKIAWVSFAPFAHNTVSWEHLYALYCSHSQIQSGTLIEKLTDEYASDALVYNFKDGVFNNPHISSGVGVNTYGVNNNMPDYDFLTFGLAQDVSINGRAIPNKPINAVSVPRGHRATFTPYEKVEVYLEANTDDGMVLSNTRSTPILISYGQGEQQKSIRYNNKTGSFYLA